MAIDKYIKIELKNGNTPRQVLDFLEATKIPNICFLLPRDFLVITEENFLKQLRHKILEQQKEVVFVTPKRYFQEVLGTKKIPVQGYEPEVFEDIPPKTFAELDGKIMAKKNVFAAKKIDFSPKAQAYARPKFSTKKIENLTHEKSLRGLYFFLFLFVIGGLSGLFLFISPRAEVVVKPKISIVETTQNIIIGLPEALFEEADEFLPSVPGILVETEIEEAQTFPSTDRSYELTNAYGQLSIYNETNEPKFLLPSRLKTEDGIVVRTQSEVIVPPRKDGKPGKTSVEVVADEYDERENPIGTRGNLDPDTELFFPALRSEIRGLYYAKTDLGPLVGGSTLTHHFVAENDFVVAKELLGDSFRIQATENLKLELQQRSNRENKQYIFLDNPLLLVSDLLEYKYDESLVGKESQAFSVSGKMRISGLVFDQAMVLEILAEKLKENQDHRKKIIEVDSSSISYRVLDVEHFKEQKWIKLSVSLAGVETLDFEAENPYAKEWQQSLKKEILGITVSEARGILLNRPEIEKIIKLEISPWWVKKIPLLLDQIRLEVEY